jgi:hypothetical protein
MSRVEWTPEGRSVITFSGSPVAEIVDGRLAHVPYCLFVPSSNVKRRRQASGQDRVSFDAQGAAVRASWRFPQPPFDNVQASHPNRHSEK